MNIEPLILENNQIKLILLTKEYKNALLKAAKDGELWKLWYTSIPSENTIDTYISTALQQLKEQKSLPFVIIHKPTNKIIGTTRYCNVDRKK